jgi:hypothetical protein
MLPRNAEPLPHRTRRLKPTISHPLGALLRARCCFASIENSNDLHVARSPRAAIDRLRRQPRKEYEEFHWVLLRHADDSRNHTDVTVVIALLSLERLKK